MLSKVKSSNLTEALLNAKKVENKMFQQSFQFVDQGRNKIRATSDRHMETFVKMTNKRHEVWHRNDKHFREALRKEKELYEKRKRRNRQKLLAANSEILPIRTPTPFEPLVSESIVLPEIVKKESTNVQKRPEPGISKVERRTFQVLRASQKLLEESSARSRFKYDFRTDRSVTPPLTESSSSSSLAFSTMIFPVPNENDCQEYERLVNQSLEHDDFHSFVDHFIEFTPEFRERFARINEANKRQRAIDKIRRKNQLHAESKDGRFHDLLDSLTMRNSAKQKQRR